jgi:hypothetical protein
MSVTTMTTHTERARQHGYDDGYDDGRAVEREILDAGGASVYYRPEWMSDEQWQRVSAEMTEHWLTLLEESARSVAPTD